MKRKGFTLIELLIVITIIGILAVALVPRIIGGSAEARDARRQTDVQAIATGLEYYLSENGNFSGISVAVAGAKVCSTDPTLMTNLSSAIGAMPSDPKGIASNAAFGASGCADYVIYFMAESASNTTVTKYAVAARTESPAVGDDFTYQAVTALTTPFYYSTLIASPSTYLTAYASGTTSYYVIY